MRALTGFITNLTCMAVTCRKLRWLKTRPLKFCLYFLIVVPLLSFGQTVFECADFSGTANCTQEEDPGSTSNNIQPRVLVANPVNLITGNKFQLETDFNAHGSSLSLRRFYNSADAGLNFGVGQGWRTTYHVLLQKVDDEEFNIVQSDGRRIVFRVTDGKTAEHPIFSAVSPPDGSIEFDGEFRYWKLPQGRVLKFRGPFLVDIKYNEGSHLTLKYQNQRLFSVTDQRGKTLKFLYTAGDSGLPLYSETDRTKVAGHVSGIQLPDGAVIQYHYDQNRNLTGIDYPDGSTESYEYQNKDFPNHLTAAVQRHRGSRSEWVYDLNGHAIGYQTNGVSSTKGLLLTSENFDDKTGVTKVTDGEEVRRYYWLKDVDAGHVTILKLETQLCSLCSTTVVEYAYTIDNQLSTVSYSTGKLEEYVYDENNLAMVTTTYTSGQQTVEKKSESTFTAQGDTYTYDQDGYVSSVTDKLGVTTRFKKRDGYGNPTTVEISQKHSDDLTTYQLTFDSEGRVIDHSSDFRNSQDAQQSSDSADSMKRDRVVNYIKRILDRINSTVSGRNLDGIPLNPHCPINPSVRCQELETGIIYGELSQCVYVSATCPLDWDIVNPADIPLPPELFYHGPFRAELFHDPILNSYALVFVGTNDLADWNDNIEQGTGTTSSQYTSALNLSMQLQHALPGANITISGHSLGGGLATAAALNIGAPAVVFNSAALHPNVAAQNNLNYSLADQQVTNYVMPGEIVTHLQDLDPITVAQTPTGEVVIDAPSAPGIRVPLRRPNDTWMALNNESNFFLGQDTEHAILLHSMAAVMESLETEYEDLRCRHE